LSEPSPRPAPLRAISRVDLTAACVNSVIGSAIFGLPGPLTELTGPWSPLAYVIAGLGIFTVVLCFAEVASRFEAAGGQYLYVSAAFGSIAGFHLGWLFLWTRISALGANLALFADYAGVLWPGLGTPVARVAMLAMVAAFLVAANVRGVRQASWTIDAFTVAKVLPLLVLIGLGLFHLRGEVLASQAVARPDWTSAILLLVFAYGGFESPLIAAGEARDPKRDAAPSLFFGLGIVAVVYVLVQLVVVGVLPNAGASKTAVADAFSVLVGTGGATVVAVAALVSTFGYSVGSTLQGPRLLYAMGERRDLPAVLARISRLYLTPDVAIVVYGVIAFALAAAGSFAAIATFSAIVRLAVYGLTCVAALILRRRRPGEAPGFRMPAAWLVAPLGVLFCIGLLLSRTFEQAGTLVALVLLGAALRAVARRGASASGV